MPNEFFVIRDSCPACGCLKAEKVYEADFETPPLSDYLTDFYSPIGNIEFEYLHGAKYILMRCKKCFLIFQKEIANDQLMKRLYEVWIDPIKVSEANRKKYSLDYFVDYAQEIIQIIAHFDRLPATLRFLDFGMGWGRWITMAKAFGCEAFGFELSDYQKRHGTQNGIRMIAWDEIPGQQFTFINTEQVFEHIAKPLEVLHHLKKGLAPDGMIKISVPTANNIASRLEAMNWKAPKGTRLSLNPVAPLEHINFYGRKSLRAMAEGLGLQEITLSPWLQYRYTCAWGTKNFVRKVRNPIQRTVLKNHNYVFFKIKSLNL